MDIYIENVLTSDDFEIVQTVGYIERRTCIQYRHRFASQMGICLTIQFVPSLQNPMISGIEVLLATTTTTVTVPTSVPIPVPVVVPTKVPNNAPTKTPTKSPTKTPTKAPTPIAMQPPTPVTVVTPRSGVPINTLPVVPPMLPAQLPIRRPTTISIVVVVAFFVVCLVHHSHIIYQCHKTELTCYDCTLPNNITILVTNGNLMSRLKVFWSWMISMSTPLHRPVATYRKLFPWVRP
jgi:hypothetical protein